MATATVNKVITIFPRYKQKRQVLIIHYLVFVSLRCLVNSLKNLIPHYIHIHRHNIYNHFLKTSCYTYSMFFDDIYNSNVHKKL